MTEQDPKAKEKQAKKVKEDVRPAVADKVADKARVWAKEAVKVRDKAGGGSKVENGPKAKVANKIGLN